MTEPQSEGWIFGGYTDGGKAYDGEGREIDLSDPPEMPDGIDLGPGKWYWRPAGAVTFVDCTFSDDISEADE